jgi:curved DNA-binding protein CbpA
MYLCDAKAAKDRAAVVAAGTAGVATAKIGDTRVELAGHGLARLHARGKGGGGGGGGGGERRAAAAAVPEGDTTLPLPAERAKMVAWAAEKKYYHMLGLQDTQLEASEDEIRRSFRRQQLRFHPDKAEAAGGGHSEGDAADADTENVYIELQKAHDVLTNADKRRAFDSQCDFDDSIPKKDSKGDFYAEYGAAFARNARFSSKTPAPELGGEDAPAEAVKAFYAFWFAFDSWRDFTHLGEHDLDKAEWRGAKREMERENKAAAAKGKAKEVKRVAELVLNAHAKDPRVKAAAEAEKRAKEEAQAAKTAGARAEAEAKARAAAEEAAAEAAARAAAKAAKAGKEVEKKHLSRARGALRRLCAPLCGLGDSERLVRGGAAEALLALHAAVCGAAAAAALLALARADAEKAPGGAGGAEVDASVATNPVPQNTAPLLAALKAAREAAGVAGPLSAPEPAAAAAPAPAPAAPATPAPPAAAAAAKKAAPPAHAPAHAPAPAPAPAAPAPPKGPPRAWTLEEKGRLAKAADKKYPAGTTERWEKVAVMMNKAAEGGGAAAPFTAAECFEKAAALKADGGAPAHALAATPAALGEPTAPKAAPALAAKAAAPAPEPAPAPAPAPASVGSKLSIKEKEARKAAKKARLDVERAAAKAAGGEGGGAPAAAATPAPTAADAERAPNPRVTRAERRKAWQSDECQYQGSPGGCRRKKPCVYYPCCDTPGVIALSVLYDVIERTLQSLPQSSGGGGSGGGCGGSGGGGCGGGSGGGGGGGGGP